MQKSQISALFLVKIRMTTISEKYDGLLNFNDCLLSACLPQAVIIKLLRLPFISSPAEGPAFSFYLLQLKVKPNGCLPWVTTPRVIRACDACGPSRAFTCLLLATSNLLLAARRPRCVQHDLWRSLRARDIFDRNEVSIGTTPADGPWALQCVCRFSTTTSWSRHQLKHQPRPRRRRRLD